MVAQPRSHLKAPPIPRPLIAVLVLIVLAAAVGYWWLTDSARRAVEATQITASGTIEADETAVSTEISGRVAELFVDEGAVVKAGDPIARLDPTLLQAQLRQAQAATETTRASLALLQAGARPEDLRQAKAALDQATATRDAAEKGWKNAVALRDDPQDLKARINAAETQVASAQGRLDQVKNGIRPADLDAARSALQATTTSVSLVEANSAAQEKIASEALAAAVARLKIVTDGPRAEDIRSAELGVEQSKNALYAAQSSRDGLCGNTRNPAYTCDAAKAQVAAAETAVTNAQNNLQKLHNGSLPEEIRSAQAIVEQARASLAAIQETNKPTLAAARAAQTAADARLKQLTAGATPEDLAVAQAGLDQAKRNLTDLTAMRDNPLAANAQVDAARGQFDATLSGAEVAQAKYDALAKGPTDEQLAVAKAQVSQAESATATVEVQLAKLTLTAPVAGTISKRSLNLGEMLTPGSAVVGIVALDPVKLTVYVPEPKVGRVSLGQEVELTVDPYPGEVFHGQVTFIAPKAEFTPRNVQSEKDRATTVFAVKVRITNADGRLKPGLPADARVLAKGQ